MGKHLRQVMGTLLVLALCLHQSAQADPGIRIDHGVYPEPSLPALPPAGGTLVDPTFGTTILRVTDEADGTSSHTAYSFWPTFNGNSTRFHILAGGVPTLYSFDPGSFTILGKEQLFSVRPPNNNTPRWEDAIWSGTDPDVLYCHEGLRLWSYNVVGRQYTLIKDFQNELPPGHLGRMTKSVDDDTFAFRTQDTAWQDTGFLAWRRDGDEIRYVQGTPPGKGEVDKSGRFATIGTGLQGVGVIQTRIVDLETGGVEELTDDGPDYAPGHRDYGHGTVVGADNWRNRITFRELDDPHQLSTVLSFGTDWSQDMHISMLADDEAWALVSLYVGNTLPSSGIFRNEILQVAVDRSERVRRLAHHRSVYSSYWDSPRANISRDGRFVAFTSTWGDSGRRDVFIVKADPISLIPGDADGDGKVDGEDLARWQQFYDPLGFHTNCFEMGDWNADGKVDGGDMGLWQQSYDPLGTSMPSATTSQIPEPTTLLLLGPGFAGVWWRRRRRHGKRTILVQR